MRLKLLGLLVVGLLVGCGNKAFEEQSFTSCSLTQVPFAGGASTTFGYRYFTWKDGTQSSLCYLNSLSNSSWGQPTWPRANGAPCTISDSVNGGSWLFTTGNDATATYQNSGSPNDGTVITLTPADCQVTAPSN